MILSVLAYQNIETFSEERGFNRFLVDGWKAMTALGLASWATAGFFLFGGASIALWADRWLRRFLDQPHTVSQCGAIFDFGETWNDIVYNNGVNINRWSYNRSGGDLYVILDFDAPVIHGHIFVASTSGDPEWMELSMSDRYAVVVLKKWQLKSSVYIGISAESASGSDRRQQPHMWQESKFFHDLNYFIRDETTNRWSWRSLLRLRR